jgi:hypothetical protein
MFLYRLFIEYRGTERFSFVSYPVVWINQYGDKRVFLPFGSSNRVVEGDTREAIVNHLFTPTRFTSVNIYSDASSFKASEHFDFYALNEHICQTNMSVLTGMIEVRRNYTPNGIFINYRSLASL